MPETKEQSNYDFEFSAFDFHDHMTVIQGNAGSGRTNIIKNIIKKLPKQQTIIISEHDGVLSEREYKDCEYVQFSIKEIKEIIDKQFAKISFIYDLNDIDFLHDFCGKLIEKKVIDTMKDLHEESIANLRENFEEKHDTSEMPFYSHYTLHEQICSSRKKYKKLLRDILDNNSQYIYKLTDQERLLYVSRNNYNITLIFDQCGYNVRNKQLGNHSIFVDLAKRFKHLGITILYTAFYENDVTPPLRNIVQNTIFTENIHDTLSVYMIKDKRKRIEMIKKSRQISGRSSQYNRKATILYKNGSSYSISGLNVPLCLK